MLTGESVEEQHRIMADIVRANHGDYRDTAGVASAPSRPFPKVVIGARSGVWKYGPRPDVHDDVTEEQLASMGPDGCIFF